MISSIIIPLFNQWEYTRDCLKALAATLKGQECEIIAVDNASSDATPKACQFLGRQLFGENFKYIRNEENRNFAGACNQGARAACGDYLVFLNNDTVVQPGWHEKLLADFQKWPDLAGTGPLLIYPSKPLPGHTVQHLGVSVSPFYKVGHLHEGIPADSPLAKKRRFFQIITAACLMTPRKLFLEAGGFDEGYVNGFEDVDFCARMSAAGKRFTVNPDATVIHYQGRSLGRHDGEHNNTQRLKEKALPLLKPDKRELLQADGLDLGINEWQIQAVSGPEYLNAWAQGAGKAELIQFVAANPYSPGAWKRLLELADISELEAVAESAYKLIQDPRFALSAARRFLEAGKLKESQFWFNTASAFCRSPATWHDCSLANERRAKAFGDSDLACAYAAWRENSASFYKNDLKTFIGEFDALARGLKYQLSPFGLWSYPLWRETEDMPAREKAAPKMARLASQKDAPAFSIVMPVFNPDLAYLDAAIESVIAQTWPRWELLIADDSSTDPSVWPNLEKWALRDKRVKIKRRAKNGGIAAASNTALAMASKPWVALLDQDDLLEPDALGLAALGISENPEALLLYSDEDKIDESGDLCLPYFKNGRFDPELFPFQNFVNHLGVYRADRLKEIGGFREGYEGAQDHDLAIRHITGARPDQIIRIPHVLYHWRIHEGSTAKNVAVKSYVQESAAKIAQEWLDREGWGGKAVPVPETVRYRAAYPLPKNPPLCSLIIDFADAAPPANLADLAADYPVEIIALASGPRESGGKIAYYAPPGLSAASRANWAVERARGKILGFLSPAIKPLDKNWLSDLCASLLRPDVGAIGGSILRKGNLLHSAYMADGDNLPIPILEGANPDRSAWFAWNLLARSVDALDGLCLFTKKDIFRALNGFEKNMGAWAAQDYCLRLNESGKRAVWWPYVRFEAPASIKIPPAPEAFRQKWGGVAPMHESLLLGKARPLLKRAD